MTEAQRPLVFAEFDDCVVRLGKMETRIPLSRLHDRESVKDEMRRLCEVEAFQQAEARAFALFAAIRLAWTPRDTVKLVREIHEEVKPIL